MTATNNVRWSSEKSSDARQFVLRRLSQHHSFSSSSTSSGFRHESHHGCCFIQHIDDIRSHKHQSPFLHFFSDFSIWYSFSSYLRYFYRPSPTFDTLAHPAFDPPPSFNPPATPLYPLVDTSLYVILILLVSFSFSTFWSNLSAVDSPPHAFDQPPFDQPQ